MDIGTSVPPRPCPVSGGVSIGVDCLLVKDNSPSSFESVPIDRRTVGMWGEDKVRFELRVCRLASPVGVTSKEGYGKETICRI